MHDKLLQSCPTLHSLVSWGIFWCPTGGSLGATNRCILCLNSLSPWTAPLPKNTLVSGLCARSVMLNSLHPPHPKTVAHQAPLSMGFSRQEYWNELPFAPPGDLPNSGIEHNSSESHEMQADSSLLEPLGTNALTPNLCSKSLLLRGTGYSHIKKGMSNNNGPNSTGKGRPKLPCLWLSINSCHETVMVGEEASWPGQKRAGGSSVYKKLSLPTWHIEGNLKLHWSNEDR